MSSDSDDLGTRAGDYSQPRSPLEDERCYPVEASASAETDIKGDVDDCKKLEKNLSVENDGCQQLEDENKAEPQVSCPYTGNNLPSDHIKFFVGGLHPSVDEHALSEYFSKYGTIVTTQVMRDFATKRTRGFGFVTLVIQDNTDNVFTDFHAIDGKKVDVRHIQNDVNTSIKRKIFVGGISKALSEQMLEDYFGRFGSIEKVTIMRQIDGSSRGFGFVQFSVDGAAEKVLTSPSHFVYGAKVDVRAAETRSKQAASRGDSYHNGYSSYSNKRERDYNRSTKYYSPMIPGVPTKAVAAAAAAAGFDPHLYHQQLLYQQYAYYAQQAEVQASRKELSRYAPYRSNYFDSQPYSQNNIARTYRHDPY